MSATNSTPNYGLPQYVADDKPTYLGDFNKAMLDIDTNMKSIDNKAEGAESGIASVTATANQALENANQASTKADTAQATATQAQTTATSAKNTAETAQSTATQAQSTATQAQTTATQALAKTNIVFDKILETDQNIVNIPNLDFANNIGYKIYINGTGEITNGSQGDLMTICAEVPGATKLINRMMGMQIVPTNENVMKIQNDNFQGGLVLNRFTSRLGGISESILQFRPNSGTDNLNLLHCMSNWGIANNTEGSCGQISSTFRGQGLTNVTELNINAGTNCVLKAGTRITVEVIK